MFRIADLWNSGPVEYRTFRIADLIDMNAHVYLFMSRKTAGLLILLLIIKVILGTLFIVLSSYKVIVHLIRVLCRTDTQTKN